MAMSTSPFSSSCCSSLAPLALRLPLRLPLPLPLNPRRNLSFSSISSSNFSLRKQKPLPLLRLSLNPRVVAASAADKGGPPPLVLERFQGVIDQLFQHRIVRLGGPLEDDVANVIVSQLLYLDSLDPAADIVLLLNSPGGSVTAGMAIFDTMKHIRAPVATVCVGLAASMAGFLLGAGSRGKRFSLPNARIMIHQPMGGAQGSQSDMEIQANEVLHHRAVLSGYLAYHTGQPLHTILKDTDRDFFMSAQEAKDYGLVDHVITNPLKALRPHHY